MRNTREQKKKKETREKEGQSTSRERKLALIFLLGQLNLPLAPSHSPLFIPITIAQKEEKKRSLKIAVLFVHNSKKKKKG
jgi:hypothetical protein